MWGKSMFANKTDFLFNNIFAIETLRTWNVFMSNKHQRNKKNWPFHGDLKGLSNKVFPDLLYNLKFL